MNKIILLFVFLCLSTMINALTVSNNTAGNLETTVGPTLTTCTSLTVTGEIDARDFKTIKTKMPALTTIDLSGTSVVAYTGTEGVGGTTSQVYAAKALPGSTFNSMSSLTSVILPNTITSIGIGSFTSCTGLTTIVIPDGVTSIGSFAFSYCSGLTSIVMSNSLTSVGMEAFSYCSGLTSLTLPGSLSSIGSMAFYYCTGLKSLTIPNAVTSIGDDAFDGCRSLNSITINKSIPIDLSANFNIFLNVNKTSCTLYVPKGSVNAYKAAVQWKDFVNIAEITASLDSPLNATSFHVTLNSNKLRVYNITPCETFYVYDINGTVISKAVGLDVEITLPEHGLYVVKVGSQTRKVLY